LLNYLLRTVESGAMERRRRVIGAVEPNARRVAGKSFMRILSARTEH